MTTSSHTADLATRIDALLPQTQCTRCGYPRCRDYAQAMAEDRAEINRCPPGGEPTLQALAELLDTPVKPIDPACGTTAPRLRAVIDEAICIGCKKCIDACPVDAILGARKLMHTVIADECTGCELCLPPCPVNCIELVPAPVTPDPQSRWPEYPQLETARWRQRTEARLARLDRRKTRSRQTKVEATAPSSIFPDRETIRADIRAALARTRQKRHTPPRT